MRQAEADGAAGAAAPDPALGDEALGRLLDREHVFEDDLATGADAGARLPACWGTVKFCASTWLPGCGAC